MVSARPILPSDDEKVGIMGDVVVLEWTFSPPDYFEGVIEITRDEYVLRIDNGIVEAKIDPEAYDRDPNYRIALHELLNARFLAIEVLTHNPYNLSKSSMYRLHPDGRKDVTVFPEAGHIVLTGGATDILVKDKDGNIVADTRRDRIEKKKKLADLAEKHRNDTVLMALLNSYAYAVRDPNNELVHLYEIRDAVAKKFGDNERTAVGISSSDWKRLGQLANSEPIRQGRHRGKTIGALRDATELELKEARVISCSIIAGYLAWLESNSANVP